VVKQVTAIVQA